jgi:probable HAF family extracellular repeat protein
MKGSKTAAIVVVVLVVLTVPIQMAAQDKQGHHRKYHHYKLIDLGTFGGSASYFQFGPPTTQTPTDGIVNRRRTFVGSADTSTADPFPAYCFNTDCLVSNAFRWRNHALTNLGALPGGGSSAALWTSASGPIAGISENGETDPLYSGLPEVRAVLWEQGKIHDLGTLEGGYESFASAVNSRGQVVGAALNTTADANSMQAGIFWLWGGITPPYQYQTRAFLWDKQNGMQDLGTLPGGTDAQAILINEPGQVVGYSYTASTQSGACFPLATSSFFWEKGKQMSDLGGFGGTCTLASDLNNRGQVVGTSNLKGDRKSRAFFWQRGMKELRDLGTLGGDNAFPGFISDTGDIVGKADLPGSRHQYHHAVLWRNCTRNCTKIDLGVLKGDACSRAYGVNSSGQVVGNSESEKLCDLSGEHAFLWEDGQMTDLDALIPAHSPLKLSHAFVITDGGEIAGLGVPPGCARSQDFACGHAYVLIPCNESDAGSCGEQVAEPPMTESHLLDTQP